MGLPEININFTSLAASAIQRSQRGVVALILADDGDFDTKEYKAITDIKPEDWSEENLKFLHQAFLGVPSKVIAERVDSGESIDYADALDRLAGKRWNYLAIPGIDSSEAVLVATVIKSWRDNDKKTFKAVLPKVIADHEGIINFTTDGIKVGEDEYTASEYTARIAGILAGLPLTRSATYYVLPEVSAIEQSDDPDADIDAGQLILINDGEKIKIGRGVNSLTTIESGKSADWKKIKIIEGMDLIKEDISRTFENQYVGQVPNTYDNQVLFFTAVNAYLRGLQPEVLDPGTENRIQIDVEAQRQAWEGSGTDTSEWTDDEVKEKAFGSKVFVRGRIKLVDAMEDIDMTLEV